MRFITTALLLMSSFVLTAIGQEQGPQPPIVLEWADSLKGAGPTDDGVREFIGNVKFKQGNVTVTCDRAVHEIALNRARLYGHVVIKQGTMKMLAPYVSYDGNNYVARADSGVSVFDEGKTITAKQGTYSTKLHTANFTDSVVAVDDTLAIWSDRATYSKDTRISSAAGRVVMRDTIEDAWMRSDSLLNDPGSDIIKILGNAAVWQCREDTLFIIADSIIIYKVPSEVYIAKGNVELVNGNIAARADSIDFSDSSGRFNLVQDPTVWADSMQLVADTIKVMAPKRKLESITGSQRSLMVSRSDTVRTDRYDQISGDTIILNITEDTVRSLLAFGDAQSITWRIENDEPQGMAQFASDSIKAYFIEGKPENIYWLGGIQGQHHPEKIAASRVAEYLLPGFVWRLDRPAMRAIPQPFSPAPFRTQPQRRLPSPEQLPGKMK
jgi:lipopolysaccharide export system protein LptA